MIDDKVIREMYKRFSKPAKSLEQFDLPGMVDKLSDHHRINVSDGEMVIENLEEFNPFRRFLLRSLNGIVEFDRMIAFIFANHIVFFGKESPDIQVHFKPEKKQGLFGRLFGR